LTFIASRHCEPDRFPGVITEPVVPPARAARYKCGEAWSIIARHASGHSLLIHGSAGYVEGALHGQHADVAYLGIGQLGKQDDGFVERYWHHTVRTAGARRVVLIHWDNFFAPAGEPARAFPRLVDDLSRTIRVLTRLADADRITLNLPTPFAPADPWHGIG
jgi:L-ascorbate metabolism protein UlaG (beta-lactamase superfamily)